MKIAIGSDHRGADLRAKLSMILQDEGCEMVPCGACGGKICDYPDTAYPVARAVADGLADRGILICGSGIGMSIAANKIKGIRAALVHDELSAEMSRRHNDANVICLPADMVGPRIIERVVHTWLATEFEGGRHERRVRKITAIEEGHDPSAVTVDVETTPLTDSGSAG